MHQLLSLLTSFGEFVVFTVVVKMIIGHWIAEQILKYSKVWFAKSERNMAIWTHYQLRALGNGHGHDSVLHCHQDRCAIL